MGRGLVGELVEELGIVLKKEEEEKRKRWFHDYEKRGGLEQDEKWICGGSL